VVVSIYRTRIGNEGQGIHIRRQHFSGSTNMAELVGCTVWTTYFSQWRYRLVHSFDSTTLKSEHKKKSSPRTTTIFFLCSEFGAPPPSENHGAAASRIFNGAPARQPELTPASRKIDGSAAEGSTLYMLQRVQNNLWWWLNHTI